MTSTLWLAHYFAGEYGILKCNRGHNYKDGRGKMPRVAIVDDALLIRIQMKKFFEDVLNYEVVGQGADGNEAVQVYKEKKPDLMTLDLTMPNKSGVEAIREIIQDNPDARILVVSAIKEANMITEALHLGAKGFVNKPLQFSSQEFVDSFKEDIADALAD